MKLYVLIRTGIYRHEIGGIFLHLDEAFDAAYHLVNEEEDNHHSYELREYEAGVRASKVGHCDLNNKETYRDGEKIGTITKQGKWVFEPTFLERLGHAS